MKVSTDFTWSANDSNRTYIDSKGISAFRFINADGYESKKLAGESVFLELVGKKTSMVYYKHDLKCFHYYMGN